MPRILLVFLFLTLLVVVFLVLQSTFITPIGEPPLVHHGSLQYIWPSKNGTGNVPDVYFKSEKLSGKFNKTCAKFPDLFALQFRNDHWQIQAAPNGTIFLFNAYLDHRYGEVLRVVIMYDVHPVDTLYCQLWYDNLNTPIVVPSKQVYWLFRPKWGADSKYFIHPYLVSCPAEEVNGKKPVSVSVVAQPCQNPTNNLKIFDSRHEGTMKKNFVVCVKGMSFPFEDNSARLAEWIELLTILGADKINFYEFSTHPKTKKLLDYYESQGRVEVTPLSLVGDQSNLPLLQNVFLKKNVVQRRLEEVIPYNDCLYKHLHAFKYVVLLDTDEVIVPATGTWTELLDTLEMEYNVSSLVARNVYFLDSHLHDHDWFVDIPKDLHMLQHVYRARNYTKKGQFVKGFHNTSSVVSLHNHYPFSCFNACKNAEIDLELAHLQHYRADCVKGVRECDEMKKESVMDMRVWNFKDELIGRVQSVFAALEFDFN